MRFVNEGVAGLGEEGRGGGGKYLGGLRLDLPGTSERAVDFSHDFGCGCVVLETAFVRCCGI